MENMTDINDELDFDPDNCDENMGKILAILIDIPEVPLPDGFNMRLGEALKDEGQRIREERKKIIAGKGKWRIKAAAAVAACFVVVFASVSVYNDIIPSLSWDSAEESTAGDIMLKAAAPSDGADDLRAPETAVSESVNEDKEVEKNQLTGRGSQNAPVAGGGQLDSVAGSGQQELSNEDLFYGIQSTEADVLSREGSKCFSTLEEYRSYLQLIEVHLSGYEYEITACEKDNKTGACLFTVLLIKDPEGQSLNVYITLKGESGVIYEEQAEEPQDSGD